MKIFKNTHLILFALFVLSTKAVNAQLAPKESDFYRMTTVPTPEGVQLEGGGVEVLQDGSVAIATRRGDVWIIENPRMEGGTKPNFKLFASGLHEPLGLVQKGGSLYTAQRGELTKLTDTNGDRIADEYETIYAWPLSTHYHEYSFGPVLGPDNSFFVTMNVAFGLDGEWWRGDSRVPWRGWMIKITEDGEMTPWATGMRSPAGPGMIDGEMFYADNQGDYIGSGGLWHVPKGAFIAHPAGLNWAAEPGSPVKMRKETFFANIDSRQEVVNGRYVKPENIENEEDPDFVYEMKGKFPGQQLPAVILPHGILGISNSQVIVDQTGGKFGPFEGQVFIGDQGQSKIMRVVLEKVKGEYQGVAFDFRTGFQSGVMRMDYDQQGNMFVGETNRGWGSAGGKNYGLEYISWTGKMPFEMKTVTAKADGFEIEFTKPIDKESAQYLDSYYGKSYVYKYHPVYGSPQTNLEDAKIRGVKVSEDGMKVRIVVDNIRQYYVHEFTMDGIRDKETGSGVLHPVFYYNLNNIPEGDKVPASELSTKRLSKSQKAKRKATSQAFDADADNPNKTVSKFGVTEIPVLTDGQIEGLLKMNTCIACHQKDKRVVGPSFQEVAKRNYSNEKIVELIYRPQPKNWPEYATPMAPMPHVPKDQALKIAAWINSLN